MICEKCGKEINELVINKFQYDGSDVDVKVPIVAEDNETGAVYFDDNSNWTGYELTEEEQSECIYCPHCGKFPFEDKEIQVYDIVRVVCFKKERDTD